MTDRYLTLRIRMENAAFTEHEQGAQFEAARLLEDAARRIKRDGLEDGILKDINGGTVGGWNFEEVRSAE